MSNTDTVSTTYSIIELENIKTKIENMSKYHHVEFLKILKKNGTVKLNENKSGVFVNLSFLPKSVIDEMVHYMNYINDQETSIQNLEHLQDVYKKTFFNEKLENTVLYNSVR